MKRTGPRRKTRFSLGIFPGFISLIFVTLASCGANELGSGVGNPAGTTKIGAAAASLFSQENSEQQRLADVRFQSSCVGTPASCFCEEIRTGFGGIAGVSRNAYAEPGTYGSTDSSVNIASDETCDDADGNPQSGNGSDGLGLWGYFELTATVTATCDDNSTVSMLSGSAGIHRNTEATGNDPAYQPQIYGTFNFTVDGQSGTLNCALFLLEDSTVGFADCSDENGATVTQNSESSCSVN